MRALGSLVVAALLVASCSTPADEDFSSTTATTIEAPELDADPDGPAEFEVVGERAYMIGEIGSSTPDEVEDLIEDYPEVTTIVLVEVPGSGDDAANLEAARMVREAGLATHVPADGEIASGGVDFFLAGETRSFDDGARFGVHSWGTGDPDFNAVDLDEDDPEHDTYLSYYEELGVDTEFYWFTIEAAPPLDIHWMTSAELTEFGFATQ